jgi:hypothetical protein
MTSTVKMVGYGCDEGNARKIISSNYQLFVGFALVFSVFLCHFPYLQRDFIVNLENFTIGKA